jgi:hypothetical protein
MSAIAQLGLDASGFIAGIAASKAAIFGFKTAVSQVASSEVLPEGSVKKTAATLTAAVVALTAVMAKGTQMAIAYGSSLVDISYNAGLSAAQTMALQLSVQRYGLSADSVVPATQKFNAALQDAANGTGPLAGVLQRAGISMDSLAKMDVANRMTVVAQAIKAIKHPTEEAQVAMAVFGHEGVKLTEALQPGKINSATAALGSQASLMEQNAGIFARISQIMAQSGSTLAEITAGAKNKIQGFFVGIASELAPEILSILDSLGKGTMSVSDAIKSFAPALAPLIDVVNTLIGLDFAKLGKNLGKEIAIAFETVKGFKIKDFFTSGKGVGETIRTTFEKSRQALMPTEEDPKMGFLDTVKTRFSNLKTALSSGTVEIGAAISSNIENAKAEVNKLVESSKVKVAKIQQQAIAENPTPAAKGVDLKIPPPPTKVETKEKMGGFDFVSSLAKIGGSKFGPATSIDRTLEIQRAQLEVQRKQEASVRETNAILKIISGKTGSSGVVYG